MRRACPEGLAPGVTAHRRPRSCPLAVLARAARRAGLSDTGADATRERHRACRRCQARRRSGPGSVPPAGGRAARLVAPPGASVVGRPRAGVPVPSPSSAPGRSAAGPPSRSRSRAAPAEGARSPRRRGAPPRAGRGDRGVGAQPLLQCAAELGPQPRPWPGGPAGGPAPRCRAGWRGPRRTASQTSATPVAGRPTRPAAPRG